MNMELKETELQELEEEINFILSMKNDLSREEINNLVDTFTNLTEIEVRSKITQITGDDIYVNGFNDSSRVEEEINLIADDTTKNEEDAETEYTLEKFIEIQEHSSKEEDKIFECENKTNELFIEPIGTIEPIESVESIKSSEIQSEILNEDNDIHIQKEDLDKLENLYIKEEIEEQIDTPKLNRTPLDLSVLKAEVKHNHLYIEWDWPLIGDKVVITYRHDRYPKGFEDEGAVKSTVIKMDNEKSGKFIMQNAEYGNYYFCIYVVVSQNGKITYSDGKRRLLVNKKPSEIYYDVKIKRNLLGKLKSAEILVKVNDKEEIKVPSMCLIAKKANMPIQKCDGEIICNFNDIIISNNKSVALEIPIDKIDRNVYVKLFVANDRDGKNYRIISPSRETLYFK